MRKSEKKRGKRGKRHFKSREFREPILSLGYIVMGDDALLQANSIRDCISTRKKLINLVNKSKYD